jgi:hypothetical protein
LYAFQRTKAKTKNEQNVILLLEKYVLFLNLNGRLILDLGKKYPKNLRSQIRGANIHLHENIMIFYLLIFRSELNSFPKDGRHFKINSSLMFISLSPKVSF